MLAPLLGVLLLFTSSHTRTLADGVSYLSDDTSTPSPSELNADGILDEIADISVGSFGSLCISHKYRLVPVPLDVYNEVFDAVRQKTDMVSSILNEIGQLDNKDILKIAMRNLIKSEPSIETSRVLTYSKIGDEMQPIFLAHANRTPKSQHQSSSVQIDFTNRYNASTATASRQSTILQNGGASSSKSPSSLMDFPWLDKYYVQLTSSTPSDVQELASDKFMINMSNLTFLGRWTHPYFLCASRKWLVSYSVPLKSAATTNYKLDGVLSVDISVSSMDINQCDATPESDDRHQIVDHFMGSHKCDNITSRCVFKRGLGWVRGGYICECRAGFFPFLENTHPFNGSLVELAYRNKMSFNNSVYDQFYRCKPCAAGCDTCVDSSACLAPYDWSFRIVLLSISMSWVLVIIGIMGAIYKYRRLKVFRAASPVFLCITLLGCAIMYAEMAAIFPELNTPSCVATKWTRHLGFCLTYSSLLMKTWRVSLTYRVKSAHKLKLTDQQLLSWMLPIIFVMAVYLGAWTLSATPHGETILTGTMKFTQCSYNWWDHSLAIGEFIFLIWGIKVCYSIRHAETYFNETRHISWAVYNIAIVNIVMVCIHLFLLPDVGPDTKYLFGFIRTQLSTSVTIALIFGHKLYLVATGAGDEHDNRARARGVTASFSLNGINVTYEEPPDLYRENEELKEELQKLASQMEFMKIVHMGLNNRHLRPKSGGYFHPTNATDVLTAPLHSQRHLSDVPDIQPSVNVVHFEGDPVPASSQRRKPKVDMTPLDDLPPPMPATPTPPPPPLSLSVEEIVIPDDSLTAELLNEQV